MAKLRYAAVWFPRQGARAPEVDPGASPQSPASTLDVGFLLGRQNLRHEQRKENHGGGLRRKENHAYALEHKE
jgi:hypothetical protein